MINEKKSINAIKVKKITDHIAYQIIGNTIYLLQKKVDISADEVNKALKKISSVVLGGDILNINISANKIEDRKVFYQSLGFSFAYYDVHRLCMLYPNKKNKSNYRCYGFMTKKNFLTNFNAEKENRSGNGERELIFSNNGYVSNLLLLFFGIILLCFVCVEGAIYLVK